MYIVEVEGFDGNTRIFDMADVDKEKNLENAVEYAQKTKKRCVENGLDIKITVEERYYDYKKVVLTL